MEFSTSDILAAVGMVGGFCAFLMFLAWRAAKVIGRLEQTLEGLRGLIESVNREVQDHETRIRAAEAHIAVCPLVADQRIKLVSDTGVPGTSVPGGL